MSLDKEALIREIDELYVAKFKHKILYTYHKLLQSDYDNMQDDIKMNTNILIDKLLIILKTADEDIQIWVLMQFIRMAKQENLIQRGEVPGDIVKVITHVLLFYNISKEVIKIVIEVFDEMDLEYLIAVLKNIRLYLKGKKDVWIDYGIQFEIAYMQSLEILMKSVVPKNRVKSQVKDRGVAVYRKLYQDCWILLIKKSSSLELSEDKLKMILRHLPDNVLPHVSNLIAIADCLLSNFFNNDDIECNVLSLSSLFYIATKGKLSVDVNEKYEEDGFYSRLYYVVCNMLNAKCMSSELQTRTLVLIRDCVLSGMIPEMYAIKFIKKLIQLVCFAPSHLRVSLLSLTLLLYQRHLKSCKVMIHTEPHIAKLLQVKYDLTRTETLTSPHDSNYRIKMKIPEELSDCIITDGIEDIRPVPCLWELDLLSKHSDKDLALLANSICDIEKLDKKIFNAVLVNDG